MILVIHSVVFSFAVHRVAVKLAAEAKCEIGNVDHFLNFASSFNSDLSHFEGNESAEVAFVLSQSVTDLTNDESAFRSRHHFEFFERSLSFRSNFFVIFLSCLDYCCDNFAVDRRNALKFFTSSLEPTFRRTGRCTVVDLLDSEPFQKLADINRLHVSPLRNRKKLSLNTKKRC